MVSMKKKRARATSNNPTTAALTCPATGLPAHILGNIFRLLHEDASAQDANREGSIPDCSDTAEPGDFVNDLRELSIFPNAVSKVCTQWDRITASHPEFWTRVIIHLDQRRPLEFFKAALKRSKRLDISTIAIVRSADDHRIADDDEDYEDPDERANIEALLTHLMNCRPARRVAHSFIVDVLSYESLPFRINKLWSSLDRLILNSRHCDDVLPLPMWSPYSSQKAPFSSALRVLHLVGPIFAELTQADGWQSAFADMDLDSFKVSHLCPMDFGNRAYIVEDLWQDLRNAKSIRHLSLVHIDLPHDIDSFWDYYNEPEVETIELESLYLEDIPRTVLPPLLMYLTKSHRAPFMRFKNCRFHGIGMAQAITVELANIESPDSVSAFLHGMDATHLRIVDCPGFDDESLASLHPWTHFEPDRTAPMPKLESLVIVDCPEFTHRAVKEVLKVRSREYEERNWNTERLQRLVFRGSCPAPTQGQTRWYSSNVAGFDASGICQEEG
ncbi:hypothetical protein FA13DRAFT_1736444 [Coprinellus micaceus]|uniref:F-box domain-containing protein n=1 Tax=Coprinellus micaceus TaxID=71717 RepID=A0A4Y7T0C2_COPMI|nr:hypothetical protein FA13DRAFT_1736444 [Coprinellus micaceus]